MQTEHSTPLHAVGSAASASQVQLAEKLPEYQYPPPLYPPPQYHQPQYLPPPALLLDPKSITYRIIINIIQFILSLGILVMSIVLQTQIYTAANSIQNISSNDATTILYFSSALFTSLAGIFVALAFLLLYRRILASATPVPVPKSIMLTDIVISILMVLFWTGSGMGTYRVPRMYLNQNAGCNNAAVVPGFCELLVSTTGMCGLAAIVSGFVMFIPLGEKRFWNSFLKSRFGSHE